MHRGGFVKIAWKHFGLVCTAFCLEFWIATNVACLIVDVCFLHRIEMYLNLRSTRYTTKNWTKKVPLNNKCVYPLVSVGHREHAQGIHQDGWFLVCFLKIRVIAYAMKQLQAKARSRWIVVPPPQDRFTSAYFSSTILFDFVPSPFTSYNWDKCKQKDE